MVTSRSVLEHMPNPLNALIEQKRVLKKDGLLQLTTDNASWWRWSTHLLHHAEGYKGRGLNDKHYMLFHVGHLRNLLVKMGFNMRFEGYEYYQDRGFHKLDRVLIMLGLSFLAYPRIRVTAWKSLINTVEY